MRSRLRGLRTAILIVAGLSCGALSALLATLGAAGFAWIPEVLGPMGLVLYALGATRLLPAALNWGLGLLVAGAVAGMGFQTTPIVPLALLQGVAIYAAAELGWLAAVPPMRLSLRSGLARAGVALGALLLGYLALAGLALPIGGGAFLTVAGVAAAALIFLLLRGRRRARVTSRSAPRSP